MTEILEIKKDILELLKTDNSNLNVVVNFIEQGFYSVNIFSKKENRFKIQSINMAKRINGIEKIKRIHFNNIVFDKSFENLFSMINIFSCNNYISTQESNTMIKNNNMSFYFNRCKFEMKEIFLSYIASSGLCFYECIFDEDVVLSYCVLASLYFESCNIKKNISIIDTKLSTLPLFKDLINKDISIFFINVEFQNGFEMFSSHIKDVKELCFKSIVFKKSVLLHDASNPLNSSVYESKLYMSDIVFEEPMWFMKTQFKNGFEFSNVTFKKEVIFTEDFINANYNKNAIFNNLTFYKKINFKNFLNSDIQEIEINNCNFKDKFEFPKQKEYKQKIKIIDTTFDDRVDFVENAFCNNLVIKNCVFSKDLSFKQTKFIKSFDFIENKVKDNIDFSDVIFEISPNFQSSVFEKLVILYKTKFKEIPNFYSASFSSSAVLDMPLVDIKDYSFNHLKNERKNKNDLIDIKGVRECLNIFKNALLKTNNILEASKYKVLELYAKELELDYKLEHKKELEEKITIKERFDRWFLKLNRTTSDHHTDFLKIFLFTLSVIGGYFMINFGLSFDEKIISSICNLVDLGLAMYGISVVIFLLCLGYEFLFVLKGFSKDKGWLIFIFLAICVAWFCLAYSFNVSEFSVFLPMIFIGILAMIFILLANNIKYTFISFATAGFIGILCNPSIITPFLGAFSEDARNHYLYKAIDELDSQKALDLSKQILAKEPTSKLNAKKTLKDYKDELKSSDLLDKAPELKRAIAIDCGVSRLNIAYYLVFAFCIFALQKTMRKNSIIPS
ncbi:MULTISPECIES: hypothetical protein [unclassified Campylobacter]|uniref:hypothetical protein n=1 Tax=unclassified Campylobacter TaxID=2593542 RepID=UPI001DE3F2E5|nr:hypothetical protein [Campylobacter sp. RM12651]MBZ7993566.1 hypothetical protein [Campylobacter sp. RM9333]ULO02615.1 putative membrane protein [Campylobacter sp. RM12651]